MDYKEILKYIIIIIIGIFITHHMNVVTSYSMEPIIHKGDIIFVDSNVNKYPSRWYNCLLWNMARQTIKYSS